jgi:putative endonuclease
MPPSDRISLGKQGEELACTELERRGYEVLARRYRTRYGEIDIVARHGATLVFAEVKARVMTRFGAPEEAVTPSKQARVARMAAGYLMEHGGFNEPCRFDVVSVLFERDRPPVIEVFENAFDVDL